MKKLVAVFGLIVGTLSLNQAQAAGWHQAKIERITIWNSGYVSMRLNTPIPSTVSSGCSDASVVISTVDLSNAGLKGQLAIAQLAMAQSLPIVVYVDGCNVLGMGNNFTNFEIRLN